MLIIALAIALFLLLFKLVKCIALCKYEWYRTYMTVHDKIFYNLFIRYILQATLKIQIASWTTLMLISWLTISDFAQGAISIALFAGLTMCPIFFAYVMCKNYKNLNRYSIQKKIGSMYLGIWLEELNVYSLTYSLVFLIRRSIFVVLTFALFSYPGIQIQVFIFSSLLYIIYLNSHRIYAENFTLQLENLNEFVFLTICYHLVLFTNLVSDPFILDKIGLSMIISTAMILGIGIIVIVFINIKTYARKLKLRNLKIRQKRMMDQIKKEMQDRIMKEMQAKYGLTSFTEASLVSGKKAITLDIEEEKKEIEPVVKYRSKISTIFNRGIANESVSSDQNLLKSFQDYETGEFIKLPKGFEKNTVDTTNNADLRKSKLWHSSAYEDMLPT